MDLEANLESLQRKINYFFKDICILKAALTHKSYSAEHPNELHNESLEFLGDAVLSLVISTELYRRLHQQRDEGSMTKIRSSLINRETLAKKAKKITLGEYIRLGKGEEKSLGKEKDKILANCFEAIIASIYLDGGMENAEKFIKVQFEEELNNLHIPKDDYKSIIQEYFQKHFKKQPKYLVEEINHNGIYYKARLIIDGQTISFGYGKSKKLAKKDAAKKAVEVLLK